MSPVTTAPTVDVHLETDWARRSLIADVRRGLGNRPLRIPPQWLYDERGSELFDLITRLPEYYATEAERSILQQQAATIAELTDADTIIELGSGTSDKTHTLLRAFTSTGQLRRFIPFDVSEATLREAATTLARDYPGLLVHGVVGDFHQHLTHLPSDGVPMVAFLGSTIGNLDHEERQAFLSVLFDQLGSGAWLLLGVDLVKPVDRLVDAYHDPQGITAEFIRNVLHVLNRELHADFDVESFDHVAMWDPLHERMDLRLRANGDHLVHVRDAELEVEVLDGEEIHVEISTKFRISTISTEIDHAGFQVRQVWTDPPGDVALLLAARP
ncbi:MAG: L-histidine N(alpha)-methyltransferase [Ilumatobacter sp.]|nr:MAG: L-histidine N(alpha)-methyltransferase [Ilumatobacter sp.]